MAGVDGVLQALSTEQKVGQLFVAPVGRHSPDARAGEMGYDAAEHVAALIHTYHVGGVCYFPGFSTTVFPAASAGAIFHVASISGAFHGVMSAQTPAGSQLT